MSPSLFPHGGRNPVRRKQGIKAVIGDDDAVVRIVERGRKAATHHVAQHIEQDHIVLIKGIQFLEQLHGFPDDVAPTPCPGGGTARFHTIHAAIALVDHILWPDIFVVVVLFLEGVDDRGDQEASEGKGAVVFRVAADLEHFLAPFGEGCRDIATGCGLANATFAINCEFHAGLLLNLDINWGSVSVKKLGLSLLAIIG